MSKTDFLNPYSLEDLHVGLKKVSQRVRLADLDSFSPYTIHSSSEIDILAMEYARKGHKKVAKPLPTAGLLKAKSSR